VNKGKYLPIMAVGPKPEKKKYLLGTIP